MSAITESNNSLAVANSNEIQISDYLRNIIENKVNGVALTCFERLVHWFLTTFTCCCSAYNTVYQDRVNRVGSIEYFSDGTILRDLTARQIAYVDQIEKFDEAGEMLEAVCVEEEYIAINGLEVVFLPLETQKMVFGKAYNTDSIEVLDVGHRGLVQIIEKKRDGTARNWLVNTNKSFTKSLGISEYQVYVTEDAISQIEDSNYLRRNN